MGDLNSMAIFQRAMEQTFSTLEPDTVEVYADDIFQGARTFTELQAKLRATLECVKRDGWKISARKCLFGMKQIRLLGFVVSSSGVAADPEKIRSIAEFLRPSCLRALRSFLGLASFYRRHIQGFSTLAKPLFELMKKDVPFSWGKDQEKAFEQLK